MKNEAKLKDWGLEGKQKYYYLRFGEGAEDCPDGFMGVATICIIPTNPIYVRGVAFCNPRDQFNKKTGRAIALGRAVRAIEAHRDNDYIHKTTPAVILSMSVGWIALSTWAAVLTKYEAKLFQAR